jgi:predicted type IV restriction endonuclease
MTRDIEDRIATFSEQSDVTIDRIALNMDQVKKYNPPPNPTKMTDTRSGGYVDAFGEECWELDALDVKVIHKLVEERIKNVVNVRAWNNSVDEETQHREDLKAVAGDWDNLITKYRD